SGVKYVWLVICPRFSMHKLITCPTKSALVIIVALINGSSTRSNFDGSGKSEGLFTINRASGSFLVYAKYDTLGTVVITVMLNSRSKRSCIISMCNIPKNPQRKPNPKAAELSG